MSSIRLTNAMREIIAKNALSKSGVAAELEEMKLQRNKLACDARVFAFGGKQKADAVDSLHKKLEKMEKEIQKAGASVYISSGKSGSIRIAVGGRNVGWMPYGEDAEGNDLYLVTPNRDQCLFASDHEISNRFDAILDKETKLERRKEEIEKTVWAALNSVSTLKRLIEVWPECQELIPAELDSVKATLPALKVEDLNKLIGLPTDKAA